MPPRKPIEEELDPTPELAERVDYIENRLAGIDENLQLMGQALGDMAQAIGQIAEAQTQVAQAVPARPLAGTQPPEELIVSLPEGMVRFFSPFKSYRVVLETQKNLLVDGQPMQLRQREVHFENGIADVTEQEAAELEAHEEYGKDFWRDPTARPHGVPNVVEGPKGAGRPVRESERRPQTELVVPL
jgi:hypothetical protein